MVRVLSGDDVAFVDPTSPILNSLLGKTHLGRLNQLPQLIQDAVYTADHGLSFNNINSGLELRPGVRIANINAH